MTLPLDTRIFLWWVADLPRLSERARSVIANPEDEILLVAQSRCEGIPLISADERLKSYEVGLLWRTGSDRELAPRAPA